MPNLFLCHCLYFFLSKTILSVSLQNVDACYFCIFYHLCLATKTYGSVLPPHQHSGFILIHFTTVPQHTILCHATTPNRLIVVLFCIFYPLAVVFASSY